MLARHDEADRTAEINRAGVAIARQALGEHGFVLGDIGPFGGLMEPYGEVPRDAVERAFREQARALVEAGADAVIIETQTAFEELEIAIAAAREAGAPAVIGSIAFDRMADEDDVRTMMGISPEQAAEFMAARGCDVAGLNCGTGVDMAMTAGIVRRYRAAAGLPVMAQPNAGQPVLEGMRVLYKEMPEQMVAGLPGVLAAGARIVGGCCGSTPNHIRRFRRSSTAGGRRREGDDRRRGGRGRRIPALGKAGRVRRGRELRRPAPQADEADPGRRPQARCQGAWSTVGTRRASLRKAMEETR